MNLVRRTALLAIAWGTFSSILAPPAIAAGPPITLRWTAPGDDGMIGRASAYDLRVSTVPLTAANFLQATALTGLPVPAAAGVRESLRITTLPDAPLYYFAIKASDEAGNWSLISNIAVRQGQTADLDTMVGAPSFSSPWPNPARGPVRWAYALPRVDWVQVDVFDAVGRHVKALMAGVAAAGRGELAWDLQDDRGRPVGAGLYFLKARVGASDWTSRLVVIR